MGKFSLRKKCEFLSYLSKMCVSTHEYHLMVGKNVINLISELEMTEKSCYYPPLPLNRVGSRRSRTNSATTPPPPTESRRLLEITEKTQEIQQPQLGSSVILNRSRNSNIFETVYKEHYFGSFHMILIIYLQSR